MVKLQLPDLETLYCTVTTAALEFQYWILYWVKSTFIQCQENNVLLFRFDMFMTFWQHLLH